MSDNVRNLKDRASRFYSSGRLKEALETYQQVLAEDPNELQCQLKVGDLYRRMGEADSAVAAYLPVARNYAADGLLLKSIAVCKMILIIDADNAEAQTLLAELHAKRRSPAQVGPPVTLRGMGMSPPPGGMVVSPAGGNFNMVEFEDGEVPSGLELDQGASATGSLAPQGASTAMWATQEDDAWTTDLPVAGANGAADDDLDIAVQAPVDTAKAPPAVDPALLAEGVGAPPIVRGKPVRAGRPVEDGADEPIELPASGVAGAWPTAGAASGRAGAKAGAMAAWPTSTQLGPIGEPEEEEDLSAIQIPLFSELPRNAFIDLLVKMTLHEVEPGDVIIKEGDVGDAFFVVAEGKVRVSRRGTDGREIPLTYLSDGAFFGEMAVLQHGARTATVTAEESGQIFEIRREVLDEVIESYPSVAKVLRNFYRQRLLSTAMATHPLFTPFNTEERRGLMEMFKSRQVKASDVLLEQGKKGTGLFILLHGQLEVVRMRDDGQAVTLAHLLAGDMFGEMSLLTNGPTVARVIAATDCFVLRLSKRKFDEVIMTHPQVLEFISEVSAARTSINDALLGAQQSLTGGTVLV